jgi:hypothetical protein
MLACHQNAAVCYGSFVCLVYFCLWFCIFFPTFVTGLKHLYLLDCISLVTWRRVGAKLQWKVAQLWKCVTACVCIHLGHVTSLHLFINCRCIKENQLSVGEWTRRARLCWGLEKVTVTPCPDTQLYSVLRNRTSNTRVIYWRDSILGNERMWKL